MDRSGTRKVGVPEAMDATLARHPRRGEGTRPRLAPIVCFVFAIALVICGGATGSRAAQSAVQSAGNAPLTPSIKIRPTSGPAGELVGVKGTGFGGCFFIDISFLDADGVETDLRWLPNQESFKTRIQIPNGAAVGPGTVTATRHVPRGHYCIPGDSAEATFTVTP
jgi:hypothetical protein